jgi:ABC-type proline/glycine betaine transport system ATPase subunit
MSILDNVCYGLKQRKVSRRERRAKAGEALELAGSSSGWRWGARWS